MLSIRDLSFACGLLQPGRDPDWALRGINPSGSAGSHFSPFLESQGRERIPILTEGRELCQELGLDPLATIASGATLLTPS